MVRIKQFLETLVKLKLDMQDHSFCSSPSDILFLPSIHVSAGLLSSVDGCDVGGFVGVFDVFVFGFFLYSGCEFF